MKKYIIITILLVYKMTNAQSACVLQTFGDFEVYDLKIYNQPILFEENSHQLVDENFQPEWYLGYSAVLCPYNFTSLHNRDECLHETRIEKDTQEQLNVIYNEFKNVKEGRSIMRYAGFGKVCFRTLKIRNKVTGEKYLMIPINFYSIADGYIKNSNYNPVKNTFYSVFKFDKTIFKSTAGTNLVDIIDSKDYSQIVSLLDLDYIINLSSTSCYTVVNNNQSSSFNSKTKPDWLQQKVSQ